MALSTIPNQPVVFTEASEDCFCNNNEYVLALDTSDKIHFQMEDAAPFDAPNVIVNGSFINTTSPWTAGSGWSRLTGTTPSRIRKAAGNTERLKQNDVFTPGLFYQITINVYTISGGTFSVWAGVFLKTITGSGTISFIAQTPYNFIEIRPDSSSSTGEFTDIRAFQVSGNSLPDKFVVLNCDNEVQTVITKPDSQLAYQLGYMTANIDISGLGAGLYKIGYLNPSINTCGQNGVYNGDFSISGSTEGSGWILGSNLTLANNRLELSTTTNAQTTIATNTKTSLCENKSYSVTYTITSINDTTVTVSLGNASGTGRTTAGTYTQTIIATGSSPKIKLTLLTGSAGGTRTVYIDNILISLTNNSDIVPNLTSNTFHQLTEHECTKLFSCSNNSDAFGFKFIGTSFVPRIRLHARLGFSKYPADVQRTTDSKGKRKVQFFEGRKNKLLRIESEFEQAHDFLRLAMGFDNLAIDNTPYIPESDEYEVNWNRFCDKGIAEIEVSEQTQLLRNVNTGAAERSAAVGDVSIGVNLPGGGTGVLVTDDGGKMTFQPG